MVGKRKSTGRKKGPAGGRASGGRRPGGNRPGGKRGPAKPTFGTKRRPKQSRPIKVTPLGDDPLLGELADDLGPLPEVGQPIDETVRLNKYLAQAGIASRRHADELIQKGRVTVNGEIVTELGVRVDPKTDDVRFDERPLKSERPTYVLFNKPKGVVCTNARNETRKRVIDHLPDVRGRLFTVGRLDADSEGLIVVTNDGEFAQKLAHPRHGIAKTYAVLVKGRVEDSAIQKAEGGVWLAEGKTTGSRIRIERRSRDRTYLKVSIREGKNREIRRVFARLGHPVIALKRIRIGPLSLHGLGAGKYRFLSRDEVSQLESFASGNDTHD